MRIVVDTNIAFSAILNTNQKIARILLSPTKRLNFYSTDLLLEELNEHKDRLINLSGHSEQEISEIIRLITSRIKFIDLQLIPNAVISRAEKMLEEIDLDDIEFVALTDHVRGKLWTGDLKLQKGLNIKGWNKFITTSELASYIQKL